ncbi:uncharacterized protein LOC132740641 [Ruditapes philippinarum]|uniref:uncharacterized protein LOC132740641 n=1 Tax=Ruditapes philippinarum TaxID=129788 RepID=UPI00295B8DAD|nr:uncharacterized protein LOC132740641 [Ruditapes philippinarum]
MVTWIELKNFMCPSCHRKKEDEPSEKFKWVCRQDNDQILLNELGMMKCSNGTHIAKVINWRWKCDRSSHKGDFTAADMEGFTFALSQAVQLLGNGGSKWVASLITHLGEQYEQ